MGGRTAGGRPPKTTAEHKRSGTYRKDRHGDRADVSTSTALATAPPEHLGEHGRRLWEEFVATLPAEATASIDFVGLTSACEWWQRYRDLGEALDAMNPALDPKEYATLFKCVVSAGQRVEAWAGRFGLSPVDRARLRLPPKEEEDELDILKVIGE